LIGGNIKIHFAGAEQIDFALVIHEAGVRYFLWTILPFIAENFVRHHYPITVKTLFPPRVLESISEHTIMDSGLFCLMFGAHAGPRDSNFVERYQDALIDFVKSRKIKSTVVEIDCQKILSPDAAWKLRKKLRDKLPDKKIINVWHVEDGEKGLDRLIEFSEYIGISCLEQRAINRPMYSENIYKLTSYIKNRKPEIDIHLLGCTVKAILSRCRFCTSADSTSWQGVNRFGSIMGYATKHIKKQALEDAAPAIKKALYYCHIEPTQKRLEYYGNYYIAALLHKKMYTQCVGGQD
jgi:hypothetical protein